MVASKPMGIFSALYDEISTKIIIIIGWNQFDANTRWLENIKSCQVLYANCTMV